MDSDGFCNDWDHCPQDRENDADSDMLCAEQDDCPIDSFKTDPGVCGCGTPDKDADSDGLLDCKDACPQDATNDVDSDGVCGQQDACPNDSEKSTTAGVCGCGTPDKDADSDGLLDCQDACPQNPEKSTTAGVCGCGTPDADADSDGLLDCVDTCPSDATNDADSDGICGAEDDCPTEAWDLCTNDEKKAAPSGEEYNEDTVHVPFLVGIVCIALALLVVVVVVFAVVCRKVQKKRERRIEYLSPDTDLVDTDTKRGEQHGEFTPCASNEKSFDDISGATKASLDSTNEETLKDAVAMPAEDEVEDTDAPEILFQSGVSESGHMTASI